MKYIVHNLRRQTKSNLQVMNTFLAFFNLVTCKQRLIPVSRQSHKSKLTWNIAILSRLDRQVLMTSIFVLSSLVAVVFISCNGSWTS